MHADALLIVMYKPALHSMQVLALCMDCQDPAVHRLQLVEPCVIEYVPAMQARHDDDPETIMYVPAVHAKQSVLDDVEAYVPVRGGVTWGHIEVVRRRDKTCRTDLTRCSIGVGCKGTSRTLSTLVL